MGTEMLTAKLNDPKTLEEFYRQITDLQHIHHSVEYTKHHDCIQRIMEPGFVYKELGTHQGASAAAALLSKNKPRHVHLVDHRDDLYEPNSHLFKAYCKENDIGLKFIHADSTSDLATKAECDVLLIDSLHKKHWLQKELHVHHNKVRRYIVFHDTTAKPELWDVIKQLVKQTSWNVVERYTKDVGYTLIERNAT